MGFLSSDPDEEFRRVGDRVCSACGGSATCRRITTSNGLAKSYDFVCAGCKRQFTVSGLFTLILFGLAGVFTLGLAVPIASNPNDLLVAVGSALFGAGSLVFVGLRIQTARRNPEQRRGGKAAS